MQSKEHNKSLKNLQKAKKSHVDDRELQGTQHDYFQGGGCILKSHELPIMKTI